MKIKIKEEEFNIPQTINEISLRHFKQVTTLDFTNLSPMQYNLEIAAVLLEKPIDWFKSLEMNEFRPIMEHLETYKENKLSELEAEFLSIKDKIYKRIDLNKMTVGEWIDLNDFIQKGAINNLDKMLAILFRIEGEPYDSEKLLARAPMFNELEIGTVYGVIRFFQNLNKA